jgi:hypothetical protein
MLVSLRPLRAVTNWGCVAAISIFSESPAKAQQNFFNVPSSEIVASGEVFFQTQLNAVRFGKKFESNNHFCLGLENQMEVGFNVSHIDFHAFDKDKPVGFARNSNNPLHSLNPVALLTLQKAFSIGQHFGIGVGTQTGVNLGGNLNRDTKLVTLSYANAYVFAHESFRIVAGGHYGNRNYLGKSSALGAWVGFELAMFPRLSLLGDVMFGKHDFANAVVGFNWYFHPKASLVFGPSFPMPGSGNDVGFTLELNLLDIGRFFRATAS